MMLISILDNLHRLWLDLNRIKHPGPISLMLINFNFGLENHQANIYDLVTRPCPRLYGGFGRP